MTHAKLDPLSRTQVDQAGALLRQSSVQIREHREAEGLFETTLELTKDMVATGDAIETMLTAAKAVVGFREGHRAPMELVHRSIAPGCAQLNAAISSRHKRMQAILDKLRRFPHMRLSQMDDIAGCRVVVRQLVDVTEVRAALTDAFDVADVDDYIEKPKEIGYRAIHVVLRIPDLNQYMRPESRSALVEVQIRTELQNEWADQIEAATGTTGHDLKGGDPRSLPEDLVEYVRVASDIRALADRGDPPDTGLEQRLIDLREIVRPYFQTR